MAKALVINLTQRGDTLEHKQGDGRSTFI